MSSLVGIRPDKSVAGPAVAAEKAAPGIKQVVPRAENDDVPRRRAEEDERRRRRKHRSSRRRTRGAGADEALDEDGAFGGSESMPQDTAHADARRVLEPISSAAGRLDDVRMGNVGVRSPAADAPRSKTSLGFTPGPPGSGSMAVTASPQPAGLRMPVLGKSPTGAHASRQSPSPHALRGKASPADSPAAAGSPFGNQSVLRRQMTVPSTAAEAWKLASATKVSKVKPQPSFDAAAFVLAPQISDKALPRVSLSQTEKVRALRRTLDRLLHERDCPQSGPHQERLAVFAEIFDQSIHSLKQWSDLLSDIKSEYDLVANEHWACEPTIQGLRSQLALQTRMMREGKGHAELEERAAALQSELDTTRRKLADAEDRLRGLQAFRVGGGGVDDGRDKSPGGLRPGSMLQPREPDAEMNAPYTDEKLNRIIPADPASQDHASLRFMADVALREESQRVRGENTELRTQLDKLRKEHRLLTREEADQRKIANQKADADDALYDLKLEHDALQDVLQQRDRELEHLRFTVERMAKVQEMQSVRIQDLELTPQAREATSK